MKAIVIRKFGDADRLEVEEVPCPEAGPGEVTIEVSYAGVGYVDTAVRAGKFAFARPPLIPGIEVSGSIRSVGEGVTNFHPGQKVVALLTDFSVGGIGMGGYAEVARAKAALTLPLGTDDDLAMSAATIVNGATAVLAVGTLGRSARVAVTGASGGLGRALISAARSAGAVEIVAISSKTSADESLAKAGATRIVSPVDAGSLRDVDVAYDTVGGDLRRALLNQLKTGGRLVLLGNASGNDSPLPGDEIWLRSLEVYGVSTGGLSSQFPQRVAEAARSALRLNMMSASNFELLDLGRVKEAHRALEEGRGPGKFILRM